MQVYNLDHAATTAVDTRVWEAMKPYFTEEYGNPSALYRLSDSTREAVWQARQKLSECIAARPEEIYFTAGGSEADNWALKGVICQWKKENRQAKRAPQLITTAVEHQAILQTAAFLASQGVRVTCLPVDEQGRIRLMELENAMDRDTALVSVMAANNEIGTLAPLGAIGRICKKHQVLFHTDAVQAFGQVPIQVKSMHIDLLSASAHKLGGPKGCGMLFVRQGVRIENLIHGGGQEQGRRAGTENVAGIVGFGAAADLARASMAKRFQQSARARDYLMHRLLQEIPYTRVNGDIKNRLPGNLNVTFQFANGASLLGMLDDMGIYASAGSACHAASNAASHVLVAIHLPPVMAEETIRFTLPSDLTRKDLDEIADRIKRAVELVRADNEEYQTLMKQ